MSASQPVTTYLVQFSGGIGSWAAAMRCASRYGPESVSLLFADTLVEDADLYRFVIEGAAAVKNVPPLAFKDLSARAIGLPPITRARMGDRKESLHALRIETQKRLPWLHWIADGRTPWEVFRDERYVGNSRVDPCSKLLKRELCDKWRSENADPGNTVCVLGVDWLEAHRFERAVPRFEPWRVIAPMCEKPLLNKAEMLLSLQFYGIQPPKLYADGFPHNNCGGFCVKAGISHFVNLYRTNHEYFIYNAEEEEEMRRYLGKDVSILKDRSGGETKTLTLFQLAERIESGTGTLDLFEWGGCGCFTDTEDARIKHTIPLTRTNAEPHSGSWNNYDFDFDRAWVDEGLGRLHVPFKPKVWHWAAVPSNDMVAWMDFTDESLYKSIQPIKNGEGEFGWSWEVETEEAQS